MTDDRSAARRKTSGDDAGDAAADTTADAVTTDGPPDDSPDPRRWKALALLGAAFFMVILDSTIVLTAIPAMQDDLGLEVSAVQWVLTGYAVTFGSLLLFFGRVADLLGRRAIFLVGTAVFVVASLACGFAWTGIALIVARLVQGASAAVMAPTALSLVMVLFRDPAERNRALGLWGSLGGIGATAGLLAGGVITATLGWEWIFFINVPVGVVVLVMLPRLVGESRRRVAVRRFDAAGAITITAALALLISAIVNAPDAGWASAATVVQLGAAVVLIAVFALIESRSSAPLVPLRIFGMRTLTAGNLIILAIGLAVDGMLFPLTLYAQQVLGFSPLQFGLACAVMTVASVAGAFGGQAAVTRFGLRAVAVPALVLIVAATLLLSTASVDGSFFGDLFWPLLIFGLGMGAAFVAGQIAALHGVPPEDSGLAAGLVDTSFHIGSALGIAIATAVATSVTGAAIAQGGAGIEQTDALAQGLRAAFLAAAVFAAAGLPAALLLPRRRRGSGASGQASPR
ncbi:MFS transporter [Agromyces sp. LHK192]|uniref:MFS transporter n=1 Tax=Agromyces sp. LHK192 TaxID=2498704 RepID=UPI000FD928A7|nr:MFS transporter [Agromyces sp. LHK192]